MAWRNTKQWPSRWWIANSTTYAKRNSGNSKCFHIDDIPIRDPSPPQGNDFPAEISIEEATRIANRLMNNKNLVICRKTGMMQPKQDVQKNRRPTSSEQTNGTTGIRLTPSITNGNMTRNGPTQTAQMINKKIKIITGPEPKIVRPDQTNMRTGMLNGGMRTNAEAKKGSELADSIEVSNIGMIRTAG